MSELSREEWERLLPLLRSGVLRLGRVRNADLSGLDLSRVDLLDCSLNQVNLSGCNLTGAKLVGARLDGCNLTGAKLVEACLEEADLTRSSLTGVQLTRAKWNEGTRWPAGFDPTAHDLASSAKSDYTLTRYQEFWTGKGRCCRLSINPDWIPLMRRVWQEAVCDVELSSTRWDAQVEHGASLGNSRYQLQQLQYAGAGDGYPAFTEALSIADPPAGRGCGVVYNYDGRAGSWFAEFDTAEQADAAYDGWWSQCMAEPSRQRKLMSSLVGFRRFVAIGPFTPWFYALGDERLYEGGIYDRDIVLPDWLTDHPTYRLGSWWLVTDRDDVPRLVQCLGASRFVQKCGAGGWYPSVDHERVYVYWSDGTRTQIDGSGKTPQPVSPDRSAWAAAAHAWLDQVLSGQRDHVKLETVGDQHLTMRVNGPNRRVSSREGVYKYEVVLDRDLPVEVPVRDDYGDVTDETEVVWQRVVSGQMPFCPTAELQTPEALFRHRMAERHPDYGIVELKLSLIIATPGGRRWSGIYYGDGPLLAPSPPTRAD